MDYSGLDHESRVRAEILLQKYFEKTLAMEEAEELAGFWKSSTEFRGFAEKNHQIDFALRFYSSLNERPLSVEVNRNTKKETFCFRPIGSPYDGGIDLLFQPLQAEAMDRLINEVISSTQRHSNDEPELAGIFKKPTALSGLPTSKPQPIRNVILVLACAVLFGWAIYMEFFHYFRPEPSEITIPPSSTFASVDDVVDPVFPKGALHYRKGQKIGSETIRLDSGLIGLRMNNGVRLVLKGPGIFNLCSEMEMFCHSGQVSAEVSEQAKGFEIRTPLMNIRDISTAFVVDVSEDECAVHVIQGEIEINHLNDQWISFTEGKGLVARPGGFFRQILADISLFISEQQFRLAAKQYEEKCLTEWEKYRLERISDPTTLVYVDFMENSNETGTVDWTNAYRTAGRWPSKNAASFSRKNNFVRISSNRISGKTLESFTLHSVVRLNSLLQVNNVIFSVGDTDRGAIHWQINRNGSLQLLLGDLENEGLMNYASPSSTIAWRDTEVWLALATTVDGKERTLTHYVDGKAVATLPLRMSQKYIFSNMELGNWRRNERTPTDKHFNGQIDEFFLSDRVLSPKEILALFHTSIQQGEKNETTK